MKEIDIKTSREVKALLDAWVGGAYDEPGLAWVRTPESIDTTLSNQSGSLWERAGEVMGRVVKKMSGAFVAYLSSDRIAKKLFAMKLDERIREEIGTEKRTGLFYREDLQEWYAQAEGECSELEVLSQVKRQLGAYPVGRAKVLAERVDALAKRVIESLSLSDQLKVAPLHHFMRHPVQAVMTPHEMMGRIFSRLPEEQKVAITKAIAERVPMGKYLSAQWTTDYLLSFVQDSSRDPEEARYVNAALKKVQEGTPFEEQELSALVNRLQREMHTERELQIADFSGLIAYLSLHYPALLDVAPGILSLLLRNQLRGWQEEMHRKIEQKAQKGEKFQKEIEQILEREKLVELLETSFAIVLPAYKQQAVAVFPEQGMEQDGWTAVANLLEDVLPVAARKMGLEREFTQVTKLTQMSPQDQRVELEKRVEALLGASSTEGRVASMFLWLRGKFAERCIVQCVQKCPVSVVEHAVELAFGAQQRTSQGTNPFKVWANRQVEVLFAARQDGDYGEVARRVAAIVFAVLKIFVLGLVIASIAGSLFVLPGLLLFLYLRFPETTFSLLDIESSSNYRKEMRSREHLADLVRRGVSQRTLDGVNASMQGEGGVESLAVALRTQCAKLGDLGSERIQKELQILLN